MSMAKCAHIGAFFVMAFQPDAATYAAASRDSLNTIRDVITALHACWVPPALEIAHTGMQITLRLSFKRNGEILGRPKITFETPDASDAERLAYRSALASALQRCTPLPFSDALGAAIAGRPLSIRFSDERKLKRADQKTI